MPRVFFAKLLLALWIAFLSAGAVQAQEDCRTVNFAPGEKTMELSGTAPQDKVICFGLTGVIGKRVSIAVSEGANIFFSIEGLLDAQDRYSFEAAQDSYRLLVGPLMRSIDDEPFRIEIALSDPGRDSYEGTREHIAQAQKILNQLGYDAGGADGIAGPRTRRAIGAFQQDAGMAVTGEMDGAVFGALLMAAADEEVATGKPSVGASAEKVTRARAAGPADVPLGSSSDYSCAHRPSESSFAEPHIPPALGNRPQDAHFIYSDGDDIIRVGETDSAEDHFAGAGDDLIFIDGPAIPTQVSGGSGGDTFIICAIGSATTTIWLGFHDLAADMVFIDEAVFLVPPSDAPQIAIHGLNTINDRVMIRVPNGLDVSFGDDLFRTHLPIRIGQVTVGLYPALPMMTFDESLLGAIEIVMSDGRRIDLPRLGPSYFRKPKQTATVGSRPRTLAGNAPDDTLAFERCPQPSATVEAAEPISIGELAEYHQVGYGEGDDIVLHVGGPAAEYIIAGAGADKVYAYDVVSGSRISGGSGADLIMLCSAAEDGLSLFVELGGTHGADIDADRFVIAPALFDEIPQGHRRAIAVFGFTPANDILELRLPEGTLVSFADQENGIALIEVGNVEITIHRTDQWIGRPFNWNAVILSPAEFERGGIVQAEAEPTRALSNWVWGDARAVDGEPAEMARLPHDCGEMRSPAATLQLAERLTAVSDRFRPGGSLDSHNWIFYSHGGDLIRLAGEDTLDAVYVKAGAGDDFVYLLDAGDGVTVFTASGSDTIVVCSMRGTALTLMLGMDLESDLVVIEPPVFLDVPQGLGRTIDIHGFMSPLDRLELRVPAGLSVETRTMMGGVGQIINVGEVEVRISDPFVGLGDHGFQAASVAIVRGEGQ